MTRPVSSEVVMSFEHSRLRIALALLLVIVFLRHADAQATQPTTQTDENRFLRFVGDGTKGGSLETADVTLTDKDGRKVRLVSAVHIAEAAYFRDVQTSVEKCDEVL